MRQIPFIFITAVFVSACTPTVKTQVNSVGSMADNPMRAYALVVEEGTSADLLLAQKLVAEHLTKHSFAASSSPELYLEVTVSTRPSALALGTKGPSGSKVLAPVTKNKKLFAKCAKSDVRLGVTLTRISNGKQAYRATASEVHCNPVIATALPGLVDAALADLPKAGASGERAYVNKRKLR